MSETPTALHGDRKPYLRQGRKGWSCYHQGVQGVGLSPHEAWADMISLMRGLPTWTWWTFSPEVRATLRELCKS